MERHAKLFRQSSWQFCLPDCQKLSNRDASPVRDFLPTLTIDVASRAGSGGTDKPGEREDCACLAAKPSR
ncbi:MAG TPA: hypothetical protein DDW52_29575 [Planctomycetaceae bacterium]|nr:hypothetical protein [Planctomycetaceae bacterium]